VSLFASLIILWVVGVPAAVVLATSLGARRRDRKALLLAQFAGGSSIAPAAPVMRLHAPGHDHAGRTHGSPARRFARER
jgi:hypothetical protein